jgi:sugar (pentulose or hexulose) kinase
VIRDWLTYEEPTTPNPASKETYDHLYSVYKDAYPRLRELMGSLSPRNAVS